MSYEFTKLSDVPVVDKFPEGANAIIETNGEIKRCPSSNTPKPLTYDYMPEGYPSKAMETVTLMEEQEVAFSLMGDAGQYAAVLPSPLEIVEGQTYTVSWDGIEYECVCAVFNSMSLLGNLSIMGAGEDTGEPFLYSFDEKAFATLDTSASHTISVKTTQEIVTPMAEEFLPENLATKSDVAVVRNTANAAKTAAESAQTTANAAKTAAESAQTTANAAKTAAESAQSTAENKFQLMQQNTVTTTVAIGTVSNSGGVVSVKGLNIAVGSTIKFTADNNVSGETVWDGPVKQIYMNNTVGVTTCLLCLELSHDGETYNFTNGTPSTILSNLVIEYEKVIIPKKTYPTRTEGAWLPPYLIANCLYLTKKSTAGSATLYRITIDDNGALTATEVT